MSDELTDAERDVLARVARNIFCGRSTPPPRKAHGGETTDRWTVSWGKGSAFYFYNKAEAIECVDELRSSGKQIRAITHTRLS